MTLGRRRRERPDRDRRDDRFQSVWFVPNLPNADGVKTGIAVILAILNASTAYLVGGVDAGEVVNLVLGRQPRAGRAGRCGDRRGAGVVGW